MLSTVWVKFQVQASTTEARLHFVLGKKTWDEMYKKYKRT